MSVRNVWTSGTKGVGEGTGDGAFWWSDRMHWFERDTVLNRRDDMLPSELRIVTRLMVTVKVKLRNQRSGTPLPFLLVLGDVKLYLPN